MFKIDPKFVKLSTNFRLSDFMGAHSVYAYGYANDYNSLTSRHISEAETLCETLLEPILAKFGPISVSYGYISPDLSRKIVKYQDPDKPSYHRWDAGAAADIVMHERVAENVPPIITAHEIDLEMSYSRMITYSESPFICVATRHSEVSQGFGRRAFYENRYTGVTGAKPQFITKSKSQQSREEEYAWLLSEGLPVDWRGAGYSTYHCGGARQLHDRRTSKYTVLTDFLYNTVAVRDGIANIPSLTAGNRKIFEAAGALYDEILIGMAVPRISIVDGYIGHRLAERLPESPLWGYDRFSFTIAIPDGRDFREVKHIVDISGAHADTLEVGDGFAQIIGGLWTRKDESA